MTGWTVGRGGRGIVLPPDPWVTLLNQTFEGIATADPIGISSARAALGDSAVGGAATFDAFGIISTGGSKQWVWHSPANTFGNSGGVGCATFPANPLQAYQDIHGTILEAAIEYDVTFPIGMDWSLGGKLPGLGGTNSTANPPTGGAAATPTGWSCRGMWRTSGSGSYFGRRAIEPNEWVGYRYCIDQAYAGENIWSSCAFVAGQTHKVRQEYKMNTVTGSTGQPDGEHRMFFDGEKRVDDRDVIWRSASNVGINRHLFHFFRGGNDSAWAASVANTIAIDNLKIQVAA